MIILVKRPKLQLLKLIQIIFGKTILVMLYIHFVPCYGLWLLCTEAKWKTFIFLITLCSFAILGVTTGAHRLWAHRTYSATTGLKIALMLFQTLAGQGTIYEWVRYHRLHHSQFGSTGYPSNRDKGFVHTHIWSRVKPIKPHLKKLLDVVDMSDLESDSVVTFQRKYYWLLYVTVFLFLPLYAPLVYWDESVITSVFVIGILRYCILLHVTWLMESGIYVWGTKPGVKYRLDSWTLFFLNKSFWPNYHYLMPRDFKSGEFGTYDSGCLTATIKIWASLRLAKDLQTLEPDRALTGIISAKETQRPTQSCLEESVTRNVVTN